MIKGFAISEVGYINQIVKSPDEDELILACERGVFILEYEIENGIFQQCSFSKETYFRGKLVS